VLELVEGQGFAEEQVLQVGHKILHFRSMIELDRSPDSPRSRRKISPFNESKLKFRGNSWYNRGAAVLYHKNTRYSIGKQNSYKKRS